MLKQVFLAQLPKILIFIVKMLLGGFILQQTLLWAALSYSVTFIYLGLPNGLQDKLEYLWDISLLRNLVSPNTQKGNEMTYINKS